MRTKEAIIRDIEFKDLCISYTVRAMEKDNNDIFGKQLVRLKTDRAYLKHELSGNYPQEEKKSVRKKKS